MKLTWIFLIFVRFFGVSFSLSAVDEEGLFSGSGDDNNNNENPPPTVEVEIGPTDEPAVVQFVGQEEIEQQGNSRALRSNGNGSYYARDKDNLAMPCGLPPLVKNGTYTMITIFVKGETESRSFLASYNCKTGFQLSGNQTIVCQDSAGMWKSEPPTCLPFKSGKFISSEDLPKISECTVSIRVSFFLSCYPGVAIKWRFSLETQTCERYLDCHGSSGGFATEEACLQVCSNIGAGQHHGLEATTESTTLFEKKKKRFRTTTEKVPKFLETKGEMTGGLRGPQCLPNVPETHSSCMDDSGDLVRTLPNNLTEILSGHNYWRIRVDPPASPPLSMLIWDQQLAISAERWAAQCRYAHNSADSRRLPNKWSWVGQNMCASNNAMTWSDCIADWGSEHKNWTYGKGPTPPTATVGHYTQIIWANTTHIGCGRAKCANNYWNFIMVCNYGAGGNIGRRNRSPYSFPYTVGADLSNVKKERSTRQTPLPPTYRPKASTHIAGGLRGPQCLPAVSSSHSSCLPDSPNLISTASFNYDEILQAHNLIRRQVSPPALLMPDLKWSQDLAVSAERWAAQCKVGHNSASDRAVPQWPWVGQNMRFLNIDSTWADTIASWASEARNYQYGVGPVPSNASVGHYTQIIWGSTTFVGCGKAFCKGMFWSYIFVCNYGQGGNVGVSGQSPFIRPYVAASVTASPMPPQNYPNSPGSLSSGWWTNYPPPQVGTTYYSTPNWYWSTGATLPPINPQAWPSTNVAGVTSSGGLRGPQCYPGVDSSHTSCSADSPNLIETMRFKVDEIVRVHNQWRHSVQPPARSMPDLQWDEQLAIAAERWAAQCPTDHDEADSRTTVQWPWVGQNMCFRNGNDGTWTDCINSWGSESVNWQYGVGAVPSDATVGHYTQIVWSDTLFVGCGKSHCQNADWEYIYVCNYGPGGNIAYGSEDPYATPYQAAY